MTYQFIINGSTLTTGTILISTSVLIVVIAILAGIGNLIWRKLRENEVLKYEFITIIAHKFRTPLTQIKWISEGLIADEKDPLKRENLADMQLATERLVGLMGTLIELTNEESVTRSSYTFERVSLCETTRKAAEAFKTLFHQKNLFFAVQCPPEDIMVNIYKVRMEFVLQTLLENACIYTHPGKNVDVTVSASRRKAFVSVTDHGIGIAPNDIRRVFSKFFRAKNAQMNDTEGFGVGLYLAQSIMKQHGGKIEVYSEGLDKGTTFTLVLPRARDTRFKKLRAILAGRGKQEPHITDKIQG